MALNKTFYALCGLCILSQPLAEEILALQIKETERMKDEIDKFCLKFDYRSAEHIEDVKDSPARAAGKLRSLA